MNISRTKLEQIILSELKQTLTEAQEHYQVDILLKYATDMSLYGDVFNKLRAIAGVTIVKVAAEEGVSQDIGGNKAVVLNVKFIPPKYMMTRYLTYLKRQMLKIKDEQGDKVLGVRFVAPARPSASKSPI